MKKIPTPHDRFFKVAMNEHRVAKAFFEQHLPKKIQQLIDLDTLHVCKESFVDPRLSLSVTDVLFSADFGGKPGYLYILAEHRRKPTRWQAFILWKYIFLIMDNHLKKPKKTKKEEKYLPLIYPLVFFNGKKAYPYSTNLLDLFNHSPDLVQQILFQPFQLVDLNAISDENLKANAWTSIIHIMMKYAFVRDVLPHLEGLISALQEVDRYGGEDYLEAAFHYFLTTCEASNRDALIATIQEKLSPRLQENAMTIAKQLREEGWQQGRQEGRQQGRQEGRQQEAQKIAIKLLKEGISTLQVAKLTELSIEIVNALNKSKIVN